MDQSSVRLYNCDMKRCATNECKAAKIDPYDACFGHLQKHDRDEVLRDSPTNGLDARGVTITKDLWQQIRKALPSVAGRAQLHRALFDGACFVGSMGFDNLVLAGGASFAGASFKDDVQFVDVIFDGETSFQGTIFRSVANFDRAKFEAYCSFKNSQFLKPMGSERDALFRRVQFKGDVVFTGATFDRPALFDGTQFLGEARLVATKFHASADFKLTHFAARASFEVDYAKPQPMFTESVSFRGAVFEDAVFFSAGVFASSCSVYFDEASFAEPLNLSICIEKLWCRKSRFQSGVLCTVRWADPAPQLVLDGAHFEQPSRLEGAESLALGDELKLIEQHHKPERPRLISLRQAAVGNLAISSIDLSQCRFAGASGLDRLRLEGDSDFAESPSSPQGWSLLRPWPPRRRWTSRRVLADERLWRHARELGDADWDTPSSWIPEPTTRPEPSVDDPAEIAAIYRALRKGLEDNRDEPGAADFYYGEMEMRRHARRKAGGGRTPVSEHVVIWLYWLVSGYALRATRALLALSATVAVLAIPLALWGFPHPHIQYGRALLFAIESSISLLRAPDVILTAPGEIIQIFLRLLGPLFFGLALLALRGRVKR